MPEIKEFENKGLAEATVVLSLSLNALGNRRRIDAESDVIQTEIDRDMLHASHALFDAPELEACYAFQRALKAQIRQYSIPSFMRGGLFLVKIEAIETVDKILTEAQSIFRPLVEAFANTLEVHMLESKEKLGPAFREGDFPSRAKILDGFGITWNWFKLSTPSTLSKISQAFFEREAKKAEDAFKDAVQYSEKLILAEAERIVAHMVERLEPDPATGKPRRFHKTLTSNLLEFIQSAPFRSVTTNEQLDEVFKRMQSLLEGVDAKALKTNDRLREDVHDGFEKVRERLSEMIAEQPARYMEVASDVEK